MTNISLDDTRIAGAAIAQDKAMESLLIAMAAINICVELCRKMNAPATADALVALRMDIVHTLNASNDDGAQVH